ncbi:MAG: Bifunctional protein Aas [Anaerolineales bacterium]|nr:Bifunctional protein Aas [Anaerolineales bacterium]
MPDQPSAPPKPVTEIWRPELIVLPKLTLARRAFRVFYRYCMKLLVFCTMRITVRGLENIPQKGPALLVGNHSGDADVVVGAAVIPHSADWVGKIENRDDHWLVGPVFRAYGFIWIHRGKPDKRALRVALDALAEGRMVVIAPEGRQTLTGGLEEGTDGATFLALKSGAPVIPIAMAGTENANIYSNMKKWRRATVTVTIGKPLYIREQPDRRETIRVGTRQIMEALARMLPPERRGQYSYVSKFIEPD